MKRITFTLFLSFFAFIFINAQAPSYKATKEKINDLVHTKLKVQFDFDKMQMPAEAWVTLKPHFYPIQEVTLDAKAMLIDKVSINGKKLKYTYDGSLLKIKLGNSYAKGEEYTVYIKYIARPEELKSEGSAAITDEKGLYFIDPKGTDPEKPTEIWTQGETNASSVWFPTLDAPNQKSSEEIYMTVPNKYVTLSNGLLISQQENGDGTRTDYWKMDEKHAPYLFFMGVGDFSVIKDTYKGKPVNYYVDHEYAPYAQEIFGNTPEMMGFFSDLMGVEYPWVKYSQMVGIDFVSGAMENTTATLHSESAYQVAGDLIDQNTWEDTIVHELFHHWFGDYVTAESFSNLTVNESFANYSEYLWREYKYGKDHADAHRHEEVQNYMMGNNFDKKLVRFHYDKKMEMFDLVTYQKGGAILHNLRNYLGDKAFFAGLNKFLKDNKFGSAEAHQLRLALEEVSGKDLNWFFNQWYFNNGHPILDIKYDYDEAKKLALVTIEQGDKLFNFPVKINVYVNGKPETFDVWIKDKSKTYAFKADKKPQLIDFDVDKTLIAQITDNKTIENYIFQYQHSKSYENRREAIEELAKSDDVEARDVLISALNDDYYGLRIMTLNSLDLSNDKSAIKKVKNLALNDEKTLVRAAALKTYSKVAKDSKLYEEAIKSKSFAIRKVALDVIYKFNKPKAMEIASAITDKFEKESMKDALIAIYLDSNDKSQYNFIAKNVLKGMFFSKDTEKQLLYQKAFQTIATNDDLESTTTMVNDFVSAGLKYKQYGVDKMVAQMLQQVLMMKNGVTTTNKQAMIDVVKKGIEKLK
jgi:aminopeptidase N